MLVWVLVVVDIRLDILLLHYYYHYYLRSIPTVAFLSSVKVPFV